MPADLFQQFLNTVNRGYGQVDKNVFKGVLPGGASISSSVAPAVKVLSTSPVYKTVRDKAAVPVLDFAMEQGIVPAKEGMFARFLSGTSVPIERIPADTRAAESLLNARLANPTEKDKKLIELSQTIDTLINRSPFDGQLAKLADELKTGSVGNLLSAKKTAIKRIANYDPRNYTTNDYSGIGATGLGFTGLQDMAIDSGLVNVLGRYQVKDGRTVGERYDFNSYNVGTPLFAEGSMVGGVVGEKEDSRRLADKALKIADTLGFIKPGAGYPVNFKFR